ncbi:MAG: hypothetical protein ACT4OE_04785 [Sphingosinicella sp.]
MFSSEFVDGNPVTEELVAKAATAFRNRDSDLQALIEQMTVPIYLTDGEGWVTFFNRACSDFAGRTPVAGEDRWCVTWRLHTLGGEPLPHDQCPMAIAIKTKNKVRGAIAVAERPDGTRVVFTPFPTPILDDERQLIGAANILIDVTDHRQADSLRHQAMRCRRLARTVTDGATVKTLTLMADEYEGKARELNRSRPLLSR